MRSLGRAVGLTGRRQTGTGIGIGIKLRPSAGERAKAERVGEAAQIWCPGIPVPYRGSAPTFRCVPHNRKWPDPRRRDRRSGSHSVRQWLRRQREDEQQVRRVSGSWPVPRGPFPQPFPAPAPARTAGGANCAAPASLPGSGYGPAWAAGWEEGVGEVGCRGSLGPQGREDRGRSGGSGERRWPYLPEGDFPTPRPGGCGLPVAWRGGDLGGLGVSAAWPPLNPALLTDSGLGSSPLFSVSVFSSAKWGL